MGRNKKEKLFLVNGGFFGNDKEFSVLFRFLVTIQSIVISKFYGSFIFLRPIESE